MTNRNTRPSDGFGAAVADARKRRRWSQSQLAERLAVSRSTVSLVESGKRRPSLDDAIAYAAVLGVSPLLLTAPTDNRPINVAPDLDVEGHVYRAWLRGNGWVRPDDVEYMPADVDRASWERRVKTSVSVVFHTHRALLDALEPFLAAGGHDAMAAASASLEDAQRSLDEFARAVAERNDPRPASRHRVSKAA